MFYFKKRTTSGLRLCLSANHKQDLHSQICLCLIIGLQILTKDSVTVSVDAVVFFRIYCPISAVVNVSNAPNSTRLLAQTTLRNVLGTKNLAELLSDREGISLSMQVRVLCHLKLFIRKNENIYVYMIFVIHGKLGKCTSDFNNRFSDIEKCPTLHLYQRLGCRGGQLLTKQKKEEMLNS